MSEQPAARWVADDRTLAELLAEVGSASAYAIDTEFHRERSYFPKLALLQLAWPVDPAAGPAGPSEVALVDPLAVDVAPLRRLLEGEGTCVMHAAQQDLEILQRACGTVPARLFDTQLAAGLVGYSTPSLASLLAAELGVRLPKGDRLTDWLQRPLSGEQRDYAVADVAHLLALYRRISNRLAHRGRLDWALAECDEIRTRPSGPPDPDTAWLRLKDHRHLRGPSRGVARAVAAWRERRAAALDQPVRFVLSDLAILGIAQRPPRTVEDLRRVRGLDERHARGPLAAEILAAVEGGLRSEPPETAPARNEEVERELRPAVALVSAWVSQLARDLRVDTALLATRADLVALLNDDPDARLAKGWRAELVGDGIRRLVDGRAALAFDGRGNLLLEDRAGAPYAESVPD